MRPFKGISLMVWLVSVPPRTAGRIHQRSLFGNGYGLLRVAGLQHKVDADVAGNLQLDIPPLDVLKTLGRSADRIDARKQVGDEVLPGVIRRQVPCLASLGVRDAHGGADHHGLGLVGNAS